MNKTHSFSTKNQTDFDFIERMKIEARRTGRNFSWVCIQALKEYKANKDQTSGESNRKN